MLLSFKATTGRLTTPADIPLERVGRIAYGPVATCRLYVLVASAESGVTYDVAATIHTSAKEGDLHAQQTVEFNLLPDNYQQIIFTFGGMTIDQANLVEKVSVYLSEGNVSFGTLYVRGDVSLQIIYDYIPKANVPSLLLPVCFDTIRTPGMVNLVLAVPPHRARETALAYSVNSTTFWTAASYFKTGTHHVLFPVTQSGDYHFTLMNLDGIVSGEHITVKVRVPQEGFTDHIEPGRVRCKAAHITELRERIRDKAALYGVQKPNFPDQIIPHRTSLRDFPQHIRALQEQLQPIYDAINDAAQAVRLQPYKFTAQLDDTAPSAAAINEVRNAISKV